MSAEPSASGVVVVDKPQGVTSHDVVAAVRHVLHTRRVGHAGTLDPMATGVLVVGFGHATRLLNYIVGADKTYEATIRLGVATDTDDADGHAMPPAPGTSSRVETLTRDVIDRMIRNRFTGNIEQIPSTYSAIKIDGRRAYDLAREGKAVELRARPVTIHDFAVLGMRHAAMPVPAGPDGVQGNGAGERIETNVVDVDVRVTCSSGTYIRALARDLGTGLGVGGHLTRLRRIRVGRFDVQGATVVTAHTEPRTYVNREGESITRMRVVPDVSGRDGMLAHALTMVQAARLTMPCIEVTAEQARDLRFGRFVELGRMDHAAAAYCGDDLVAIVGPAGHGRSKPLAVFPGE